MNLIERLRGEAVRHELKKLSETWEHRHLRLFSHFRNSAEPTREELLDLGDRLSSAFRIDIVGDRSQESLSTGGSAWQALICHYLNLCFAGTDAVALTRKFIPDCIKSSLKVSYSSSSSVHADLDGMVVYVPGAQSIAAPRNGISKAFSRIVEQQFKDTTVVVIQTKTNWNDNAQIPMLWNFIYRMAASGKIPPNGFSVGSGPWHLKQLRSFAYAFVTVPTNKVEGFKPSSMPVLRVANMSGGAYWGRPTRNGVMLSLREFFAKNYNVANHNFPPPSDAGVAFAEELRNRTGRIDVEAFKFIA